MTKIVDRYRDARVELSKIERDRNVKVLFACESGSRAWGFASKNSDYDVRFIYVRPARSYFTPTIGRDVIDVHDLPLRTDDIDLSGWDLLKTLELVSKSNPQVIEWLGSPLHYYAHKPFVEELASIAGEFNPRAMMHHYSSMAKRTWAERIRGTGETVRYKKYLYAIRPLFACFALEQNPMVAPPTDFNQLISLVEYNIKVRHMLDDVRELLRMKGTGAEEDEMKRINPIERAIEEMIPYTREIAGNTFDGRSPDLLRIDDLSVRMIREFGTI